MEKYRPNTLDDVTGHEDIITTSEYYSHGVFLYIALKFISSAVHKFVDTNVEPPDYILALLDKIC